jgi:hypothetical protein
VGDGGGTDRATGERVPEGDLQLRGADPVEELEQPGDLAAEVLAPQGQSLDESVGAWAGSAEPVTPAQLVSMPLLAGERLDVDRILDHLLLVVAARVRGEDVRAVGDPDLLLGGREDERLADEVVRNRVVVPVEADVGLFTGDHRPGDVAVPGMLGDRQQARALLLERVADEPALGIAGDLAGVRGAFDPGAELLVQVLDRGVPPGGEETVA